MATITEWLASLGLSEYAGRFRESGIDISVLPDLTEQDLKDIGVLLGHRRKMLRAINELVGTSATTQPPAVAPEPAQEHQELDGERRQVTVMFTDLVGSTALSARMDPEDLREIISAYQKCVAETVRHFGGFVAKYMGDGVLVYFGYPEAHEDDAERAVRVGLELIAAVAGLKTRASLQTRVGIATGLVVVGDLIGSGEAQERGIVGETPNLAARLQAIALPDSVVIAEGTRKLLGNLFELQDLGARDLKGLAGPVRAWVALRRSSIESRFEALHSGRTTPLVGRAEEFELLLRRWQQAKSGQGRVVVVIGEPGIGKSRITAALQGQLQLDPHARLRQFCSPHHQSTPLHPWIGQFERATGMTRDDTAAEKLMKLEALLARSNAPREDIGLIAALLSLPNAARNSPPELSPQKRKEKTLTALLAHMERLAARHPVLVVYEDVHWIDPTTLELLTLTIERVQSLPVLLLITARPEFRPPWPGYAHVTHIELGRIGRDEGSSLIAQVTGGKALPNEVLQQILARTDGIPLFIEELTKAVVESGVLTDVGDRYAVAGPLPELAIPTSLNASLLARLDRLAPVREVAQIGAALGRQFSHALIRAVTPMPQPQLDDALAQLVHAELIFRRGTPPDAQYTFKHALVQDAAYGTLLRARRRQLHGRIAATLERQFPEIVAMQPERLAQHCAEAGFVEKAVGYCLKAGQQAIARGTMAEAVAQLRKGLDILAGLSDGAVRREQELDLQIALGHALETTMGLAEVETGEAYARARQLCEQLSRPEQFGLVLYGQYLFRIVRGELEQAEHHAEELRRMRKAGNDAMWECFGAQISGNICFYLGKFSDVRAYHESVFSLWDPAYRAFAPTAEDPHVGAMVHFSRTLVCLGHLDQACSRRDEALAESQRLSPFMRAFALRQAWYGDWATKGAQSAQTILASAQEVVVVSDEHGFRDSLAIGNIMRGWCLASLGQAAEGIPLLLEGLRVCRAGDRKLMIPFFLTVLAEAYGMAGQPQQGLDQLAEVANLVDATHERWVEAEMHRLRGTLLLSMNEHAAAENSYRRALGVAQRQSARFWELRAALDLARLWCNQGKRSEARDLLSPVYGWFTEGFDTRDLKQAKALLADLAQ
ncbi:adenylate/guanylate cyclase domain-containing protein [Bradyrhizobium sp. WSM3983]|uniref:adenylate/guanylate cyclase domain-containing protein n=1 Tax=Bradyrhizobium sp. WSM3983 TaxID=1038867 RepID=UPI0004078DC7|nr:adenylate/guanylate cyclase domain-containing protein [Bradyrhizobium sp. WSM3983]